MKAITFMREKKRIAVPFEYHPMERLCGQIIVRLSDTVSFQYTTEEFAQHLSAASTEDTEVIGMLQRIDDQKFYTADQILEGRIFWDYLPYHRKHDLKLGGWKSPKGPIINI